jgi:hypothetical protein
MEVARRTCIGKDESTYRLLLGLEEAFTWPTLVWGLTHPGAGSECNIQLVLLQAEQDLMLNH